MVLLVRANLAPTAPKRRAGYQPRKATHSGRRSRRKGVRTERSIVNALQGYGLSAVRVPLSGAVGGRFAGDIVLPLIVKADRRTPPVVVRLPPAAEVAKLVV